MGQKLGQHFLKDARVAQFIVDSAQIKENEIVLEVGPGKGIITHLIAKKAKKVLVVEKDKKLKPFLDELPNNVEVIYGDILQMNFPKVDKIISNLPFYISSKFIFTMPAVPAILGLQKEFAEKMVAEPGSKNYGRLSVSSQIKFKMKLLKSFPPTVFSPQPKVSLSIIQIEPNDFSAWKNCEDFIRKVFPYLNKKVDNALKLGGYSPLGIEKKVRELTPEDVIKLSRNFD